jgi:hypothetical protein
VLLCQGAFFEARTYFGQAAALANNGANAFLRAADERGYADAIGLLRDSIEEEKSADSKLTCRAEDRLHKKAA